MVMKMKAKDIFQNLMDASLFKIENTCDGLIIGDADKSVNKIGTCFKLTAELIERAVKTNIHMIITHEPTFAGGDIADDANRFDVLKREMLIESGITVYRYHDHAHNSEPDYVHDGFIKAVDLKIKRKFDRESLGVCRYELDEALTTKELAIRIREKLGVEFVRIVGKDDYLLKTVCLGLGSVCLTQVNILFEPGCDLLITGELGEVCVDEYVRDACYFGENKSILVLGHYSSEYAGMRLLAEVLNKKIAPTVFLDGKEVYHGI